MNAPEPITNLTLAFNSEVIRAMQMLAADPRTVFLGQSVAYGGSTMYRTLEGVPMDKRMEMPVVEDFQMGFSIGLALQGKLPISIYPRMDFLILAFNQLVNHLDRFKEMGEFRPKVIVRSRVGPKKPLDAGPQHTGNYCQALKSMLRNVRVIELTSFEQVFRSYEEALHDKQSYVIVENCNG